jgi:hypothetical protein
MRTVSVLAILSGLLTAHTGNGAERGFRGIKDNEYNVVFWREWPSIRIITTKLKEVVRCEN